jgi:hypothetical protein
MNFTKSFTTKLVCTDIVLGIICSLIDLSYIATTPIAEIVSMQTLLVISMIVAIYAIIRASLILSDIDSKNLYNVLYVVVAYLSEKQQIAVDNTVKYRVIIHVLLLFLIIGIGYLANQHKNVANTYQSMLFAWIELSSFTYTKIDIILN